MAITPEDLGIYDVDRSIRRVASRVSKIREVQDKVARGHRQFLDTEARRLKHSLRLAEQRKLQEEAGASDPLMVTPELGQEAHVGERSNILSGEFLELGILASRAVCKITVAVGGEARTGTGFLVGNGIVLTNFHVIQSANQSRNAFFEFLYEDNSIGDPPVQADFIADPDRFHYFNADLDICLLALKDSTETPLKGLGWLPLLREQGKIVMGAPVNIIQHPNGQRKRVVVHESIFILVDDDDIDAEAFCWYSGDTEPGSSGSPVMNEQWEVVALHHKAIPATDKNNHVLDINGKKIAASRKDDPNTHIRWIANEGARASRIVRHLESAVVAPEHDALRQDLLALWSHPMATKLARKAAHQGTRHA